MYQKPDFVQVSVKVKDVYANYQATGCPEDQFGGWLHSDGSCDGTTDDVNGTLTSMGFAHQCYSTLNP